MPPENVRKPKVSDVFKGYRKACSFIKKETLAQVFSCEFCEISKNTFSYRTPLVAASVSIMLYSTYVALFSCCFFSCSSYSRCVLPCCTHFTYDSFFRLQFSYVHFLLVVFPKYLDKVFSCIYKLINRIVVKIYTNSEGDLTNPTF